MIKSIHKTFLCSIIFFTAILFSEKSFAQTNTCSGTYTFGAGTCNEIQIGAGIAGSSIQVCLVTNNITGGVCNPGGACNPPFSGGGWSPRLTIFRLPLTSEATWTSATTAGTCYTLTSTDGYAIIDGLCSVSGTVISWTTVPGPTATTISPTSTSVCSGGSTTLTATGGFSTIQWQSSPNNSTWTNIGGATSGTYVTPGLTSTTYYRATYTDPCVSGTTNTTTVTIASGPVFSAQPANTALCQGSSTVMSVVVSPASATYQWQYWNGSVWANVVNGTPTNFSYSGNTTANLTVSTTTSAAAGNYQYRCNVTACASTVASSAATLTINALPNAGSITPLSTAGVCGTPVNFTLTLAGGYTGTIQWQTSSDNATWVDILGQTSATYSATTNATSYYRTVQTLNSCTNSQSSTASVTIAGTTAKTFTVTSGAWGTASNWSPSGIPGTCDDVTIPSGKSCTAALDANCHNLTVNGTLTLTFSSGKYLYVHGNIINNGTITQSSASSSAGGNCSPCSGLSLKGQNATWSGTGTYPLLTVSVGDYSDVSMLDDATIDYLDATQTAVRGKLNLRSSTLKITNAFAQSASEIHVNEGFLWIAITSSLKIDQNALFPEYGTVFWDVPGGTLSGAWNTIGGNGFYNVWFRSQAATPLTIAGNQRARKNCVIVAGGGAGGVSMGGAYTIQVEGDFENNKLFTASTSTVSMEGPGQVYDPQTNTYVTSTATQNIQGSSVTTFYNLRVANTGGASQGVTLNGIDANVSNVLNLVSGPLFLNSQRLTVTNAVPAAITRTNGYVVSETNLDVNPSVLQWNIGSDASAHIIPFGTVAGDYIPVTFDGSGASGNISFSTRPTASDNSPWAGTSNVAAVNTMVCALDPAGCELETAIDRWWDITSSAASPLPAVNLSLTYRGSENTTTATGNVGFQHWTGSTWNDGKGGAAGTFTDAGVAPIACCSGTQTVNGTGFTEFSPYILMRGGAPLPLPVELTSFSADCKGDKVIAEWETASEINNDYFTLEKSTDGSTFFPIAKIPGAGNSSTVKKYSAEDTEPFSAAAYYRLSQTDYDSKTTSFDIVAVKGCGNDEIIAYSSSNIITVNVNSKKESRYNIVLLDAQGKIVLTRTEFFAAGNNQTAFPVTADNGIYILKVFNDKNIRVQKVSIQR